MDLSTISSFSIVVPALWAILKFTSFNKGSKFLVWLVLLSSIVNLIAHYLLHHTESKVNVHYFNFFAIAQFVLFNRLYFAVLKKPVWKKALNILLLLVLAFTVLNWIFLQPFMTRFNTNVICVGNISYVLFSLLYFSQLLNSEKYHNLMDDWAFWLSAGLLLYNSSAFVLFLMTNYLYDYSPDVYKASNRLNAIFNIVLTGFYLVSLFVAAKRYNLSQVDDA